MVSDFGLGSDFASEENVLANENPGDASDLPVLPWKWCKPNQK